MPKDFRINHPKLDPIYEALEENGIPLILYVSDPDTYYSNQYRDSEKYGLKDNHLQELEKVLAEHPKMKTQIPHLGAQPEIHRLPNLARWLDSYPNVVLDTASSRWMARGFMLRYSNRVLFGTDIFAGRGDLDYYSGRYIAQRILWETLERHTPLSIPDADTVATGGTFINGLDLPLDVLRKLYWENANRFYHVDS